MFGVPSPQLITTLCVSPVPESVKEPLTVVELFSLMVPGEANTVTAAGATLLIVTVWVAVLLLALSESLTWTETVLEAGPSGKVQTKLPPEAVVVVVPTWLPLAPQLTDTTLNVSLAGIGDGEAVRAWWCPR